MSRLRLSCIAKRSTSSIRRGFSAAGTCDVRAGTVHAFYDAVFYASARSCCSRVAQRRTTQQRRTAAALVASVKIGFLSVYTPFAIWAVVWAMAPEFSPDGHPTTWA